jgi:hypothetical protein
MGLILRFRRWEEPINAIGTLRSARFMLTHSDSPETVARIARSRRYAQIVLVLLVLLAVVLALQGDWLALFALPCIAWLAALWPPPPMLRLQVADPEETARARAHELMQRVLPLWTKQLDLLGTELREGGDRVMADFGNLIQEQEGLKQALDLPVPDKVRSQLAVMRTEELCDAALQGMQMVDRVSQMIDVIKLDQQRMAEQLKAAAALDDAAIEQWLAHLKSTYTTAEQVAVHHGERPAATATNGVQFF